MGLVEVMVGDAVVTFLWIFCASSLGVVTSVIESALPVEGVAFSLLTNTLVMFLFLLAFYSAVLCVGAQYTFSPTAAINLYAAGVGHGTFTLFSMAVRFPAQAAGAVGGVLAIREAMPQQYKHMLGGPSLKVDPHTGAAAEGVLTFLICLSFLTIYLKFPGGMVVKTFVHTLVMVASIVAGAAYTGPSMSPVHAFGWAYVDNRHNTWEQLYVYWISPVIGAFLAGWCYRLLFVQPAARLKNA